MTAEEYLASILNKYAARNLTPHIQAIAQLHRSLIRWADNCYVQILTSGSQAKGTAIALASDVDYAISLTSNCNENKGGLAAIYDSLHAHLAASYVNVRRQNVSVRVTVAGLEIDVTPARKQPNSQTDHWIYLSKTGTRQQTNIQKHISDVSQSGRLNEIKLIKIWREINGLEFPSIYLEYLLIDNILAGRRKDFEYLNSNCAYIFHQLSLTVGNPLSARLVDPANSNNVLSDLLTDREKKKISVQASKANAATFWRDVVW